MKTLILHVGMHKTGTSSLQCTFYNNRHVLLRYGINYLKSHVNHSEPLHSLFCDHPHKYHINQRIGVTTPEKAHKHNQKMHGEINNILGNNDSELFIISGEDIGKLTHDGVCRLRRFISPHFDRVRVIGYVRPPRSFANSRAQELIKNGHGLPNVLKGLRQIQYRFRFEKFINLFGHENVTLRVFARPLLKHGCVIASFLQEVGAPDDLYEQLVLSRKNESISLTAAKVLIAANTSLPAFKGAGLNPERAKGLVKQLRTLPGEKFLLPEKVLSKAASAVSDIAWMEQKLDVSLGQYDIIGSDRKLIDFQSLSLDEISVVTHLINKLLKENMEEKVQRPMTKRRIASGILRRIGSMLVFKPSSHKDIQPAGDDKTKKAA